MACGEDALTNWAPAQGLCLLFAALVTAGHGSLTLRGPGSQIVCCEVAALSPDCMKGRHFGRKVVVGGGRMERGQRSPGTAFVPRSDACLCPRETAWVGRGEKEARRLSLLSHLHRPRGLIILDCLFSPACCHGDGLKRDCTEIDALCPPDAACAYLLSPGRQIASVRRRVISSGRVTSPCRGRRQPLGR